MKVYYSCELEVVENGVGRHLVGFTADTLEEAIEIAYRDAVGYVFNNAYEHLQLTLTRECLRCVGRGTVPKKGTLYQLRSCPVCRGKPLSVLPMVINLRVPVSVALRCNER